MLKFAYSSNCNYINNCNDVFDQKFDTICFKCVHLDVTKTHLSTHIMASNMLVAMANEDLWQVSDTSEKFGGFFILKPLAQSDCRAASYCDPSFFPLE